MKILLDTHILIWALNDDMKLSNKAKNKIYNGNDEIFYSPLSIYEIESKREKHPDRMPICQAIAENMLFMTHDERIAEYDTPNIFKV